MIATKRLTIFLAILGLFLSATASASEAAFKPYQALLTAHVIEATPEGGLVSAFDYEAAADSPRTEALLDNQRKRFAGFDTDSL